MNRNILLLADSFHSGGTERQMVQLARLLREDGTYAVHVGCLSSNGPLKPDAQSASISEIPEFKLNSFYDVNFWTQIRRCMSFLHQHDIEIIHTHDFYTNIFGMMAGFLAGIPVRLASKRNTYSKTRNQMLVERQAFRLADRILVNAEAIRASLIEKGVPENKIVRVNNGIDLDRFGSPAGFDRRSVFQRLGIGEIEDKQIVTIVANMRSDVKNHGMFLRAAEYIKNRMEDVVFVLAGEGELIDSLKSEAKSRGLEGATYFLGRSDNIPELLSISNVGVLTSWSEGSSNAIVEYMAAGLPVVSTNVGGAAELIDEGKTGFLIKPDDAVSAAEKIATLLLDPGMAKEFGEAGRRKVEMKCSLHAELAEYLELCNSLLSTKRRITFREWA